MAHALASLLQELEDLSAEALEQVSAGQLKRAAESVRQRGVAVRHLQEALAAAGPVSYEEWNRLVVIHFQGNRVQEAFTQARAHLASELSAAGREQALLHCVYGTIKQKPVRNLNETA